MRLAPQPLSKKPLVTFHSLEEFPGWEGAQPWVLDLIKQYDCTNILEIGAGANPTLAPSLVNRYKLQYTANDVSSQELDKADVLFDRWACDLSQADDQSISKQKCQYDLVFSRMVNEHVADGKQYHTNILQLLKPGGIAAHCCSTLYALPFLVNRFIPEDLGDVLLRMFNPRKNEHKQGKFPAYYSWSRGPSKNVIEQFQLIGYDVIEYHGYFGHAYYKRIPFFKSLEDLKARALVRWPIAALCSYAMLVIKKSEY